MVGFCSTNNQKKREVVMSSIEEFWIKNNLSELDDETAQKIVEEFHEKPEDFMDIIEAFRDVEEYSSLIMSKILEINSEALNQLIDNEIKDFDNYLFSNPAIYTATKKHSLADAKSAFLWQG